MWKIVAESGSIRNGRKWFILNDLEGLTSDSSCVTLTFDGGSSVHPVYCYISQKYLSWMDELMPIGLTTDQEFERELERVSGGKKSDVHTPEIVQIEKPGRKTGDVNVPDALRQIIGEDAVLNGRQSAIGLAGMFGISPSSVSAYAKGATSTTTYNEPKSSIRDHISKSRARAIKRASKTLDGALSAITQEKLDYTDAKDLSGIAKDMSVIIKNLEPPPPPTADPNAPKQPQFVIFAPQFRDERSFDHITVSE